MKKNPSQVKHLIILGSISIFFAAYLAQAASSATIETHVLNTHPLSRTIGSKFRSIEGTLQSIDSNSITVKTKTGSEATVRLTKQTQYYLSNTKSNLASMQKGMSVKIRATIVNKYELEATSIKIIKTTTPTPSISND